MKDNFNNNHKGLSLGAEIQYENVISKAGIVFYNPSQNGKVLQIVGTEVKLTDQVQIIKNQDQYWILKACDRQCHEQVQEIERFIGLTFTIICIQISNFLQAIVQKAFSRALNHSYLSKYQIKLIFIKSTYKNKLHTMEIKYCKDTPQAMPLIYQNNYFKTIPIKVFDLIQIFDCELPENVAKIRQVYQKYEALKHKQEGISKVSKMIFDGNKQKGHILRELSALQLSSQRENKLIWKLERLNQYKEWLEQERLSIAFQCSKLTFKDIESKISHVSIKKYHKKWTANSLLFLKGQFKKISDKNDIASIKKFINQYETMKNNLQNIENELKNLPYSHAFSIMKTQLQQFYTYHQAILTESTFGWLKYMKDQCKFMWRYNNRIYKKMAAFVILIAFAYTQVDFIKSLTVFSIALIILALRC